MSARAILPLLALLATAAPASRAITIGADLSRPATARFTCSALPAGSWLMPIYAQSCTYFTTAAGLYSTAETNIVPQDAGGYGVITKVRVRTGAVSGRMQVVTFRSIRQSQSTGDPGCCWPQYASEVFMPPADSVYEVATRIPVMNDTLLETYLPMPGSTLPIGPNTDPYGGLHEASTGVQGIQNYDAIALSILDPQTTIPAQYTGDGGVLGGMFWPAVSSRTMRTLGLDYGTGSGNGSSVAGVHLLLQAVWEPDADRDGLGDESQDPRVDDGTVPPAITLAPAPTALRAVRAGRGVPIAVGADEDARLAARLLLAPAAAKRLGVGTTIARAAGTVAGGASATLTLRPAARVRRALARVRSVRLTIEVRATDADGNVRTATKALTLR